MRNLLDKLLLTNPLALLVGGVASLATLALLFAGVPSWLVRGLALGLLLVGYGWTRQTRRAAYRAHHLDSWRQHGPGHCLDGENCPLAHKQD